VNGEWLLQVQQPAHFQNAPTVLGRTALGLDLGVEYRHQEPGIVTRQAHMWVGSQATMARLEIASFQDLNPTMQNGYNSVAVAQFVLTPQ
jgi:hypothetical protein